MSERVFVDTNVLIYARDGRDQRKRERAASWLLGLGAGGHAVINLQILNELTRWILKNEPLRPCEDVRDEIETLSVWGSKPLTEEEVELAWTVRERLGYQWFDCLLIASAHIAGCRFFLTEDMTDGATFEGLTLVNPFRASPDDLLRRN